MNASEKIVEGCDCFKRILDDLKEKYPVWNGKKVEDIFWSDDAVTLSGFKRVHQIGIDIKLEHQKKREHIGLQMSFCPICGEKFK